MIGHLERDCNPDNNLLMLRKGFFFAPKGKAPRLNTTRQVENHTIVTKTGLVCNISNLQFMDLHTAITHSSMLFFVKNNDATNSLHLKPERTAFPFSEV